MTVENLIKILSTKSSNKIALVNLGFNDYDILAVQENKDDITIFTKHIDKRDNIDDGNII